MSAVLDVPVTTEIPRRDLTDVNQKMVEMNQAHTTWTEAVEKRDEEHAKLQMQQSAYDQARAEESAARNAWNQANSALGQSFAQVPQDPPTN